ncbi:hypothetical protein ACI2IY_05760 [Lysobacter enzymogenes]
MRRKKTLKPGEAGNHVAAMRALYRPAPRPAPTPAPAEPKPANKERRD